MESIILVPDRGDTINQARKLDTSAAERGKSIAQFVKWGAEAANDFSFNKRLNDELEKLKPQIAQRLPLNGGVLVKVTYTQNVQFGYKQFNSIYIHSSGYDCKQLIKQAESAPQMNEYTHFAFEKKSMYIWVTKV